MSNGGEILSLGDHGHGYGVWGYVHLKALALSEMWPQPFVLDRAPTRHPYWPLFTTAPPPLLSHLSWYPFPFLTRLGQPCLCLPKGYDPLLASTCRPVSHATTRTWVRGGHPSKYKLGSMLLNFLLLAGTQASHLTRLYNTIMHCWNYY